MRSSLSLCLLLSVLLCVYFSGSLCVYLCLFVWLSVSVYLSVSVSPSVSPSVSVFLSLFNSFQLFIHHGPSCLFVFWILRSSWSLFAIGLHLLVPPVPAAKLQLELSVLFHCKFQLSKHRMLTGFVRVSSEAQLRLGRYSYSVPSVIAMPIVTIPLQLCN